MPKRRRNINYRQTHSERSATDSARGFAKIQRFAGWIRNPKQKVKVSSI